MGYHNVFSSSLVALILCIQSTQVLGIEIRLSDKSEYTRNTEVQQILHSIKEMSEMLKVKQRVDTTDVFQVTIELQLLNLNLRLQDIERRFGNGETTGTPDRNKPNDLVGEPQVVQLNRRAEKNSQTTNTRIDDIDNSLKNVLTTQDKLLEEVRKQGIFQTQLMTSVSELKRILEPDLKSEQNKSVCLQRFAKDFNVRMFQTNASIPTMEEQIIKSVQFSINEYASSTREHGDEMKLDLANMITSFEENITDEMNKMNMKGAHQLKSVDKLLKGLETLKRNYYDIELYEQKLEDKVMSALEKLSDKIDDKTEGILSELNCLLKNELKMSEQVILEKQIRCAKRDNAGNLQYKCDQQNGNHEIRTEDYLTTRTRSRTDTPSTRARRPYSSTNSRYSTVPDAAEDFSFESPESPNETDH